MKKIVAAGALALCLSSGAAGDHEAGGAAREDAASWHMIAEAMLTAHYVAAAVKAGMSAEEVNAVLSDIARRTVIAEFWISDGNGDIVFTNVPDAPFAFPTDPGAGTQAAPFAALLTGDADVVVQPVTPRELDSRPFKYVGVAGVDAKRIVQVGIPGSEFAQE